MELVYGYLKLSIELKKNSTFHGESFNFGPNKQKNRKVIEILHEIKEQWNFFQWKEIKKKKSGEKESKLLKLNCEKARKKLKWQIVLSFKEVIKLTIDWYKFYYNKANHKKNIYKFTTTQINYYQKKILNR